MAQLWTFKSRITTEEKSTNRISYISYIAWKGTKKEAEQNKRSARNRVVERVTANTAKSA